MLIEGLISLLVLLVKGILALLPSGTPPGWFTDAGAQWSALMAQVGLLGAWVPVSLGVTVVTAILTCVGIGFTIKIVRIVLSFFTAGGGAAG